MLYALAATPLALALTALLALADASHQVVIQPSGKGVQLVLHHECRASTGHRHGFVARTLTLAAPRPWGTHADHVLEFTASAAAVQAPALSTAPQPEIAAPQLLDWRRWLGHLAPARFLPPASPRPPPGVGGSLGSTRSTVLLL